MIQALQTGIQTEKKKKKKKPHALQTAEYRRGPRTKCAGACSCTIVGPLRPGNSLKGQKSRARPPSRKSSQRNTKKKNLVLCGPRSPLKKKKTPAGQWLRTNCAAGHEISNDSRGRATLSKPIEPRKTRRLPDFILPIPVHSTHTFCFPRCRIPN